MSQEQMSCSCGSRQLALECGHPATEDAEGHGEALREGGESKPSTTPPTLHKITPGSQLEMLLREAEVIARNLKESGTRR